ncbi:MAG: TetR/AcrR family transcriptional regulator [Bacillaceae bacterium]
MKKNKPKYHKIIDAAVSVIAENGYHQAQVSKIAKCAGVADGTIYLYFKNKEDILISVFQEKMGSFIEEIQLEIANVPTASEQLQKLIYTHFFLLSSNYDLAIVTQLELRQSNKETRLKINNILKGYLRIIDQIMIKGIETGEFAEDLPIRVARHLVFGTVDEVVTNWVMSNHSHDLISLTKAVHQLLVNACKPVRT